MNILLCGYNVLFHFVDLLVVIFFCSLAIVNNAAFVVGVQSSVWMYDFISCSYVTQNRVARSLTCDASKNYQTIFQVSEPFAFSLMVYEVRIFLHLH